MPLSKTVLGPLAASAFSGQVSKVDLGALMLEKVNALSDNDKAKQVKSYVAIADAVLAHLSRPAVWEAVAGAFIEHIKSAGTVTVAGTGVCSTGGGAVTGTGTIA